MDSSNLDNTESYSSDTSISTPPKQRLGKFLDVYSREHLNLTPKPENICKFVKYGKEGLLTPEPTAEVDHKCNTVKPQQKAIEYGTLDWSFERNQSFPRVSRRIRPIRMELETPTKLKMTTDLVRVDGPNGVRFNTSLAPELTSSPGSSQAGWQQAINTSKAVFTIEPNTSKILIVNSKACSLLGYASSEICGAKFNDLLRGSNFSFNESEDKSQPGTVVLLSGKVVDIITKEGGSVQVSLWIRQLDSDGPCLVVAEPVNCKDIIFTVESETGTIVSVDSEDAAAVFQTESAQKLVGIPVTSLIPAAKLPTCDRDVPPKQKLTGRTLEGGSFPLCMWISKPDSAEQWPSKLHKDKALLEIRVRVTFNVSGLLVVDENGTITACNPHFAKLTFGKTHSEVVGHHIEEVIPNFCREADLIKGNERNRQMTLSPVHNEEGSASDTDEDSCGAFNGSQKSACMSLNVQPSQLSQMTRDKSSSALCLDKSSSLVTPTPTQDMVSSISTTEQRNELPDITSGMSGISVDEENYCQSSISKSRSENILRSEQSGLRLNTGKPGEKSESIYYTSQQSEELTPTGAAPKIKVNDPSLRFSFDSSKYKSLKVNIGAKDQDRSSLSLDFCDSNETSADFLTPINEMPPPGCEIEDLPRHNGNESLESLSNDIDLETQTESAPRKRYDADGSETPCAAKRLLRPLATPHSTSTPQHTRTQRNEHECSPECSQKDGTYRGVILHKDGTELSITYCVSTLGAGGAGGVRCVWLQHAAHARTASAADTDLTAVHGNKSVSSRPQSMSLMSQCGEEQVAGEYSRHYGTLKQIGKGAYGCVKLAYRKSDRLLCVAKFILKEKVGAQFWVDGPDGRRIPLELSLLLTLKHPNIVSVMDMYENDKYFQMVMSRHGAGMDLFEFIERRPRTDEPLLSYIFRQIGQAVEYLHSMNILHRDIKDENVIIDNKFHVKLIDFGSATFMSKDTLFSTFYGTTEYCSPEVLAGNKYSGPELEMWSMGVTLYVLVFFVNPFTDIEDTVHGDLHFPQPVSEELEQLLSWMLCKEPALRCTVPQLMSSAWLRQPVAVEQYVFSEIVQCEQHEANPETYYSGSVGSPRSGSLLSLAKERSLPSSAGVGAEGRAGAPRRLLDDPREDNYSLRSSADILDISSKPVSEGHTDMSSDATGHAACDIDYDPDQYECDSWDECEQDSFS